jgi:MerR family transcriptional regulator, light-induced transcriptional regulator
MALNQQLTAERPSYRSGAVARLTGIPVETLRVWERRYNIVGPRQSAKGQRLYSPAEVTRLTVIKKLVDSGYAIGSVAALDLEALQLMLNEAAAAASRVAGSGATGIRGAGGAIAPLRVAVVGEAISLRLERYRLPALKVVASSPNAAMSEKTLQKVKADALLIELPTLQRETPQAIRALAQQLGAQQVAVVYGFGPKQVEQELSALGYRLMRSPLDLDQLEALLGLPPAAAMAQMGSVAPRRFDNKALAEITMASVALHCECPHHLADLLMRLGNFETYSAECESRSPTDAALHHYLNEVAGSARALLEAALTRVAEAEGLALPGSET